MVELGDQSIGRPSIRLTALQSVADVAIGDDLVALLSDAVEASDQTLRDGDIVAVAHKIVSKAEGRLVDLADVRPTAKALELAEISGKDPRLVELILGESAEISRIRPGLIIARHRLGFTCANAGIDRSNVRQGAQDEVVLLLPQDPDGSAQRLRHGIMERLGINVGVLITDSHGRPFRLGTVGVAIGVAGLPAVWNRSGESDRYGYQLQHTEVATADELAAAAGLLMGQANEGTPVVIIRGFTHPDTDGRARNIVRPKSEDLYR